MKRLWHAIFGHPWVINVMYEPEYSGYQVNVRVVPLCKCGIRPFWNDSNWVSVNIGFTDGKLAYISWPGGTRRAESIMGDICVAEWQL